MNQIRAICAPHVNVSSPGFGVSDVVAVAAIAASSAYLVSRHNGRIFAKVDYKGEERGEKGEGRRESVEGRGDDESNPYFSVMTDQLDVRTVRINCASDTSGHSKVCSGREDSTRKNDGIILPLLRIDLPDNDK